MALAVAFVTAPANSQTRRSTSRTPSTESGNAQRARRAKAVTLLIETADQARTLDELYYRARVQSLAADALWPLDVARARTIFRRAWLAAVASDKAEHEERAREAGTLPGATPKVTEARDEILKKVAARDARLAEIFLRDLAEETEGGSAARKESRPRTTWRDLSTDGARRMALASELLKLGETRNAVELATPVVNEGVSAELVTFIQRLRERSITDGDALYLRLVERSNADSQTDANAVLLLSSPILSPSLLVIVDEFGALQFRTIPSTLANTATQQTVSSRVRRAFYSLAASVLLRPSTANDGAVTMQDLMARFYATGRLLPWFENSTEPHAAFAPALRARHSELFNVIEASRRDQFSSQFGVNSLTPAGYVDPLRGQHDQLSRATDAAERERIAVAMVRTAARNKYWDRARRAAAEIEDLEIRQAALSFIQVHQIKDISSAYADDKEDDFESVVKFVRKADVPPFARAWGFAQAAPIALRRHSAQTPQHIAELLSEAESYAARISQGTSERVAAYGVVTMAAARVNASRAWELLRKFVESANAVEDFTGEETSLDLAADQSPTSEAREPFTVEAEIFRLEAIFATMTHLDFEKALAEARALDGEVPQAIATIAIARTFLEEQSSSLRNQGTK